MRVTNKMLSNNFLSDMQVNLNNLKTLQQQMASGKEISKPSDDPFKTERIMQLQTDINTNKQYNDNIGNTINWLDTTDTALGQAEDVLQRVRELLVQSGNAGYSDSERQAIKDEINQKIGEFAQIANTNFDGKYIFGGTRGTTKPLDTKTIYTAPSSIDMQNESGGAGSVTGSITTEPDSNHTYMIKISDADASGKVTKVQLSIDGGAYGADIDVDGSSEFDLGSEGYGLKFKIDDNANNKVDDIYTFSLKSNTKLIYNPDDTSDSATLNQIKSKLKVEISQGVTMDYSVSASDILEYKPGSDLRDLLDKVVHHLDGMSDDGSTSDSDAVNKLTNDDLSEVTDAINNLLKVRSEVGAKQNRMDSAKTKNEDENTNMTEILSNTEDIDITEKTMEYATMQTVYLASLQTSAKVIQPSLLDYLG